VRIYQACWRMFRAISKAPRMTVGKIQVERVRNETTAHPMDSIEAYRRSALCIHRRLGVCCGTSRAERGPLSPCTLTARKTANIAHCIKRQRSQHQIAVVIVVNGLTELLSGLSITKDSRVRAAWLARPKSSNVLFPNEARSR
jgi:hypothetical protein